MAGARAEIEIVGDARKFDRESRKASGALASLMKSIRSVAREAVAFAGGFSVFEGVSKAFDFVRESAIGMNATLEQARIGFTTMLGSAQKADRFLREMADFAARTPFEFPELLEATRQMLAFGFAAEETLPMLEAIGNASAGLGLGAEGVERITRALGQMRARAKVSAEEMLQLVEAGIPAWEILAEGIGVSTRELQEMVSDGLVPADKAIRILIQGMQERFPNMMQAQSESWRGMVSTILDNTRLLIAQAFEPMFGTLKERFVRPLRDALEEARAAAEESGLRGALLALIPDNIVTRLQAIKREIQPLIDLIGDLTGWWRTSSHEGQRAAEYLDRVRRRLIEAGMSYREANKYIAMHREELLANIPPTVESARTYGELRRALEEVGIAGRDAAKAMQVWGPEILGANQQGPRNLAQQLADAIRQQDWGAVGRALGEGIIEGIKKASNFGRGLSDAIMNAIRSIDWYQLGRTAVTFVVSFALGFADALFDPMVWLQILQDHWDKIVFLAFTPSRVLRPIINALRRVPLVGNIAATLLEKLNQGGNKILEPVGNWFKGVGKSMSDGARRGFSEAAEGQLLPTVRRKFDDALSTARTKADEFIQAGYKIGDRVGAGIGQRTAHVRNKMFDLINRGIDEPLSGARNTAGVRGSEIANRIRDGINAGKTGVHGAVIGLTSSAIDSPLRTAKDAAGQRGAEISDHVRAGIASGQGKVRSATKTVTEQGIDKPLAEARGDAESRGRSITDGLWEGIKSKAWEMYWRVKNWVQANIIAPIKQALGIHSPSRLMMDYGRWLVQGLAQGINTNLRLVENASRRLAAAVAVPPVPAMAVAGVSPRMRPSWRGETVVRSNPVHISQVHVTVHARDLREMEDVLNLFRNLRQAARAGV